MTNIKRIATVAAVVAAVALPMAPAQAGPVECINEKFWGGRWVECPGDFMDCVNHAFWEGRLVTTCVVSTPPG